MLRTRFFWKVFAGIFAVVVVSHGIDWWFAHKTIADSVRSEVEAELDVDAVLLEERAARWLRTQDPRKIQAEVQVEVQALGARAETRITLIRPDGSVLADSDADPAGMESHGDRPEVVAALRGAGRFVAHDVRPSRTTGMQTLYAALAVREDGRLLGILRMARSLVKIAELQQSFGRGILLAAGIGTLVALLMGAWFASTVTRPLRKMSRFARSLAEGNADRRVEIESSDEIGELGRGLNAMADELTRRMDTISGDRNKLLAVLSDMAEGVIAVDRDDRVLHLNEVAASILGVAAKDALGRRVWEVTRVRQVCEALAHSQRDGHDFEAELEVQGASGLRTLDLKASPLRDSKGSLAGAVVVLHDVTRLRRLEVMRRDFVANVSHELKTPLTAIRGFVETLLDDPSMPVETQRRFLEKIGNQSQRLATLVSDLLTLSRVESDRQTFEHQPVDLREPAKLAVANLAAQAQKKGLKLTLECGDAAIPVRGDSEALRIVADNLLANAIQYTPAGGLVRVRARTEGKLALLEVEDTGIGIEPRDQDRIFERFYRVDKARSRELGGTGLGLAIVKHIALAHGGQVGVTSEPGHGSTFTVRLPLEAEDRA